MGLASRVFSSPTERREDRNANHGFIVLRYWPIIKWLDIHLSIRIDLS